MAKYDTVIKSTTVLDSELGTRKVLLMERNSNSSIATVYTVATPNGNCQTFSLVYMNNLISYCEKPMDIIKELVKQVGKYQMLIDINQSFVEDVKKLFPVEGQIIINAPYTSTNGSSMCIMLINVKHLF